MNKQTAILKLMATAKALEKGQLYPEGAEKDFGFILDEYHKTESQKYDSLPCVSQCACTEDGKTGTTTVMCCNICGLPDDKGWHVG